MHPIVVWIPMLDGEELPSAQQASEIFRDPPVPQFWDGKQLLGGSLARALGADDWVAWDIYLFYPPGAEWVDQGPPLPEVLIAQVAGAVVASKGGLPPNGDQERIPKRLQERVDVVGAQADFETLLAKVAESFAQRQERQ